MDQLKSPVAIDDLQNILGRHLSMYRYRVPIYQAAMLNSLLSVWKGQAERLLDVGGGTGVIAQAIRELFPVDHVHTVDLMDRFCPTLTIPASQYDGKKLPFTDGAFSAATLNNVLHHVPVGARVDLLREIRRVVNGPLYVKDHERRGVLDHLRLMVLDAAGNLPFNGMVKARYLSRSEWEDVAQTAGYKIALYAQEAGYRSGIFSFMFPNRLEVTMRLEPK